MPEQTRPQPVTDPEFPDLLGVEGGPLIPCKVTEFTVTTAPTTRVEGVGDLDATYEHTQRYVIRYQPATWPRDQVMPAFIWGNTGWWYRQALTEYWDAHGLAPKPHAAPDEVQRAVDWWNQRAGGEPAGPVTVHYVLAAPTPEEMEAAKQAVLEAALELVDEQQQPPGRVPTVTEGGEYSREHRYSPEHRYVLRAYRRAHGKPTVGTGTPTAVEVNGAVTWWNQRQETQRG